MGARSARRALILCYSSSGCPSLAPIEGEGKRERLSWLRITAIDHRLLLSMKISRTYLTLALGAVLVGVSGYVLARFIGPGGLPEGLIQANGRIEGDHVTVASKFPGRIVELAAREGARVAKGNVLIRLDDTQTRTKVDQAARLVDTVSAQVEAARQQLQTSTPDVVVLDLHLPGVMGSDLLAQIRADARLRQTKVIVATADSRLATQIKEDADLVLLKPIGFRELRDIVQQL